MPKLAIAYVCAGLAFVLLDGGFLALVGPKLYRPALGALLGGGVRLAPAALFYLLYVAGLVFFCVRPAFTTGWREALVQSAILGAVLGLVAYGTYDLTCQAVMRVWSWKVTLIDMSWGAFASASASAVGLLAARALVARMGATP